MRNGPDFIMDADDCQEPGQIRQRIAESGRPAIEEWNQRAESRMGQPAELAPLGPPLEKSREEL